MRKVAILMGSWAHRRSTITFRALGPQYQAIVIAARRCAYLGETDLQLPTRRLTAVRDIVRHIPKLRHKFGWGSDQHLFGLEKALADVDIVLSGSPTCLFSYQAARFCERTGKPLVLQEFENVPLRDFGRRIYKCRSHVLGAAELIAAATERARASLVLEGVDSRKLRIVPLGIDTELFHPAAKEAGMRQQLGFTEDQTVVLFTGQLIWEKGIFDFVHAAKLLTEDPAMEKRDLRFVIMGSGRERAALLDRVNHLNLSDRVRFVGAVPFDRVPTMYAAADMVVAPSIPARSWQEQWGLVLSEAMSTGVPVISTCSGSIPEVVGDCGILVQPADPLSLVDAIKRLASSPELRSQLGESGRARVLELYDWRVVGPLFARFFDEALAP